MAKKVKQEKREIFDIGAVAQYFALSIIFVLLIFGVNFVVRMALEASPTGQCGNGILTIFEVHNIKSAQKYIEKNQPSIICINFKPVLSSSQKLFNNPKTFYVENNQNIEDLEQFLN